MLLPYLKPLIHAYSIFSIFTDYSFATKDVKNLRILHCIMDSTDGYQLAKALTYCDCV